MAFKEEGSANFRAYETLSAGDIVAEGWVEGFTASKFKGDNIVVREGNGECVIVNHCGSLAYRMKEARPNPISIGDYIKVVYKGKEVMKKGVFAGKDVHEVALYRDPDMHISKFTQGQVAKPVDTKGEAVAATAQSFVDEEDIDI
jgi:hypothetical protein